MTIHNPLADNSPDHEDQNFVLRARSGDRQALEDLVQRHQAWIYNIAVRMMHHPQDAEDVTQEILIKVLTRLSSFDGRSSFRTWLYRIVVNHAPNSRVLSLTAILVIPSIPNPETMSPQLNGLFVWQQSYEPL